MSARHGNVWSRCAAWLTAVAHRRAPHIRWGALVVLAVIWFWAGYIGWRATDAPNARVAPADAVYRTIGALTFQGDYDSVPNLELAIARYAGMFVPFVGLVFAFSGQLGLSFARLFGAAGGGHIVIAGQSPAALWLARDCARNKDVVIVIASELPDETAWSLRHMGIMIVPGDPTQSEALRSARAEHASHVVAIGDDDTANLRIEAAARAVAARKKRRQKLTVHVRLRSPILLQEAREMRGALHKDTDTIEARPFSLDELAARLLLKTQGAMVMSAAEGADHDRPHLVMFGFDDAAEAVAVRALMSLWSARFEGPRITVVTPAPGESEDRFDARYPNARAHDLWKADIAFKQFDWRQRAVSETFLQEIDKERGPASFVVVSTGVDAENIALALGVLRACNSGLADDAGKAFWAVPIFMKEDTESEFSRQFAVGDRTRVVKDAYLQAFGAVEQTATRAMIIEGSLDSAAAMAHQFYQRGLEKRGEMAPRELEAARRGWGDVGETYRNANRAAADHAMMKLWDLGWGPAPEGVKGETSPDIPEAEIMKLAELEHTRWMAERMMSGWRPGDKRDNRLRVHPNLVAWDQLTDADKQKDADQVRGALTLARAIHKRGFVRRGVAAISAGATPSPA